MASMNQIIKPRFLPERSFLYFSYPTKDSSVLDFDFPLLENIEIAESQRPNLATYDLVGRPGNLYAYLGAKSRDFSLKFNITLPNVIDYMNNIGLSERFEKGVFETKNTEDKKVKFLGINFGERRNGIRTQTLENKKTDFYAKALLDWASLHSQNKDPNDSLAEITRQFQSLTPSVDPRNLDELNFGSLANYFNVNANDQGRIRTVANAINYVIVLTNIIRTSVINNQRDTNLGPPTIYINHGTMYNNIPCICTNYNIKLNNAAGYDIVSMTPRQIEISMTLSENRTGNFKNFIPFSRIDNLNVAGWEAVILDKGTLDPYLGVV